VSPESISGLDIIHVAVDQHRVAPLGLLLVERAHVGLWRSGGSLTVTAAAMSSSSLLTSRS
jgi:hypothetical protein